MERVVRQIAKEVDVGLNSPIVAVAEEGRMEREESGVEATHLMV